METGKLDYKKMYAHLVGAISDALDRLPYYPENKETHNLLKDALLTAEEWYISAQEAEETKEN